MPLEKLSGYKLPKRNSNLHSPAHLLAEELRLQFNEPGNFKFYLGIALRTDHKVVRRIAAEVMEKKVDNAAALFAYKIKEFNSQPKQDNA